MRETVRQDKESESKVADLKTVDSIVTGGKDLHEVGDGG